MSPAVPMERSQSLAASIPPIPLPLYLANAAVAAAMHPQPLQPSGVMAPAALPAVPGGAPVRDPRRRDPRLAAAGAATASIPASAASADPVRPGRH